MENINTKLPPQIKLYPEVIANWPIINGAEYEITMDVADQGDQGAPIKNLGLFYSTDIPLIKNSSGAPVNYAGFYQSLNSETTETFTAKLSGHKLYAFALLPLKNSANQQEADLIIGPNAGEKKGGKYPNAGSIHYYLGWQHQDYKQLTAKDAYKGGISVNTKGIDQFKGVYPNPNGYIYARFGVSGGVSLRLDTIETNLIIQILDQHDNLFVFSHKNQKEKYYLPFDDSNPTRPIFLFATLIQSAAHTESDDERHFEVGDPRIDGAMRCRRKKMKLS